MGCFCSLSEPAIEWSSAAKRDALLAQGKSISLSTELKADYYQTTINLKLHQDTQIWQLLLFHTDPEFKELSLKMLKEEIVASLLWYYDDRDNRVYVKDRNPQFVAIHAMDLTADLKPCGEQVTTSFDLKSYHERLDP